MKSTCHFYTTGGLFLLFREMETQMDLYTGGLHASNHMSESPQDVADLSRRGLLITSHALERNSAKMFELW